MSSSAAAAGYITICHIPRFKALTCTLVTVLCGFVVWVWFGFWCLWRFCLFSVLHWFKTRSCYVVQAGFKLAVQGSFKLILSCLSLPSVWFTVFTMILCSLSWPATLCAGEVTLDGVATLLPMPLSARWKGCASPDSFFFSLQWFLCVILYFLLVIMLL